MLNDLLIRIDQHFAECRAQPFAQRRANRVGWPTIDCALLFLAVPSCVLMFVLTMPLMGEEPRVSRPIVEELIRSLDARTLAERRRAEQELLDRGPDVLRWLPSPDLVESVAVREAIRRIRPPLERRAARESAAATTVSLDGDRTLEESVAQIQRQTNNRVSLSADLGDIRAKRIAVTWDHLTFWNCLDDLCDRLDLNWQFTKDRPGIEIALRAASPTARRVVQHAGPFRIDVQRLEIRPLVGDEQQRIVRVVGRLSVEPRLRPLFVSLVARDLIAVANDEKSLSPWNPDAKYEYPVGDGGREIPIQWDFRLPTHDVLNSISVRGTFHCQIAAATERIVFDQRAQTRGTTRRRGGVTVRLRQIQFEPADQGQLNGDVGLTVGYDVGGPAFESHRSWIFHNAAYLETADHARTDFTDFSIDQQADGAVAIDYRWTGIAAPITQYSLVYEAPTLILDVPIEVDLSRIPVSKEE